MTRAQLLERLQAMHTLAVCVQRDSALQENLKKNYVYEVKKKRQPVDRRYWILAVVLLGFLYLTGHLDILVGLILLAVLVKVGLSVRHRLRHKPGSKWYQNGLEHNARINQQIAEAEERKTSNLQYFMEIGGDEIYPSSYFNTKTLGNVIAVIREHRAASVPEALNLLIRNDEQTRRDAEARKHRNAVLDGQRRARDQASADAMTTRWVLRNKGRYF